MQPSIRKRLAYALLGGALIPLTYLLLLYVLAHFFNLMTSPADLWFAAPIAWPAAIYDLLQRVPADEMVTFELPGLGFFLFLIIGNFILYSLLTYLALWWKQRWPRLR